MENLIIRKATINDAEGIAKVHVRTWQCAYKGQISDDYLDELSVEKKTSIWQNILSKPEENAETFVAEMDGKVVGFCSVSSSRDTDVSKNTGELWAMNIDPAYSGKGIGSELMEHGLNMLRNKGYKEAILWVLTTNENSRKFYEKRGWKVEGTLKKDERLGLEDIRYKKDLI